MPPQPQDKNPNKRTITPPASPDANHSAKKPALQKDSKTSSTTSSSQSNNQNTDNLMQIDMIPIDSLFPESYTGNFEVIVESLDKSIGNLHPFALSKLLSTASKLIDEINVLGRNKVRIKFKNITGANTFLLNLEFHKKHQLKAYIAQNLIYKFGMVKNVPIDTTEEDLLQSITSFVKVHSIRRLQKKVDNQLQPIPVVEIKFIGNALPDYVFFYNLRCKVEPSIRNPIQCFNCLRFNHTATQCRGQLRCPKCGENHKSENCSLESSNFKCVLCQGNHQATDRTCPSYRQQKQIKRIMAFENLSYQEARNHLDNKFVSKAYTFAEMTKVPLNTNSPPINQTSSTHHKGTKIVTRDWPKEQKRQYPTLPKVNSYDSEYGAVLRAQEEAKATSQPDDFQAQLRIARVVAAVKAVLKDQRPDLKFDSKITDIVEEIVSSVLNTLTSQSSPPIQPPNLTSPSSNLLLDVRDG